MTFFNGFFVTSQAVRHRRVIDQPSASTTPRVGNKSSHKPHQQGHGSSSIRRATIPLWHRRNSWIQHLVPPDHQSRTRRHHLPDIHRSEDGRKAADVVNELRHKQLITPHSLKDSRNVELTVPRGMIRFRKVFKRHH